jgi:hypothetical protein
LCCSEKNKISEKYADYFTVCYSSIPDSDMDYENIEDSGKRSSSTYKVKYNLHCPEKVNKVFSVCSGSFGNIRKHLKVKFKHIKTLFQRFNTALPSSAAVERQKCFERLSLPSIG